MDRVASPQKRLADFVAREITRHRGFDWPCHSAAMTKVGEGRKKQLVFADPVTKPRPFELVWPVDDVFSTGTTLALMADAIRAEKAKFLSACGILFNRSEMRFVPDGELFRISILANAELYMPTWEPEHCPLCLFGSEAIRPKPADDIEGKNWARLNADY